MSFGRSTSFSGFGAASGNAFGAGPTAKGGGGQSNTPTGQPAAGGPSFSFGGAGGSTQPQPQQQQQSSSGGGGLFSFGQPQQQQHQQPASAGLFGAVKPAASTGGLFGQQSQQPQQQAQQQNQTGFGSSLFGQPTQNQNQNQNSSQQPGSSLFGGQQAAQAKPSFSSFGGFGQQQQQQQQQNPSFGFGSTAPSQTQQQQPQQQSGLFSQTQPNAQQQQLQQSNLFAASSASGSTQSFQINPASPFARQPYRQKERFNDLADGDKKLFEEMEKFINEQTRIKDELMTREYAGEMRKRTAAWNELTNGVQSTLLILQQDGDLIKGIVDQVEHDRTHLATLYDIAWNAKEGRSDGKQWAAWPGDFFTKAAVAFRERIKRYRSTVEEIERQLATIDTRNEHSPQLISDAIVHQHAIFMSLASNVASLHAEMDELKREFAQWYQQSHRSAVDPFAMSQLTSTL